jgi:hypothetical protein
VSLVDGAGAPVLIDLLIDVPPTFAHAADLGLFSVCSIRRFQTVNLGPGFDSNTADGSDTDMVVLRDRSSRPIPPILERLPQALPRLLPHVPSVVIE